MPQVPKRFLWLLPYLTLAKPHLPRPARITRLSAWSHGTSRGRGCHAAIYTNNGRDHRIYLHTHYRRLHDEHKKRFSKIDLLATLAHELAHTLDWDHTPRHKELEAKLLSIFMKKLRSEGYVSEEIELAG